MIFEERAIPAMRFFSKLPPTTRGVGCFCSTDTPNTQATLAKRAIPTPLSQEKSPLIHESSPEEKSATKPTQEKPNQIKTYTKIEGNICFIFHKQG